MELLEFTEEERIVNRAYQGNAGMKRAYFHDGTVWIVKFPLSTRNYKGSHLAAYTSSYLSEYIGSHIYEVIGIPVHETRLGKYRNTIVVACKDFTTESTLLDFHSIKNTVDEECISGNYASRPQGERLSDVFKVIENAAIFEPMREEVRKRFWDMFVIDAFIRNNDRNNGNWGVLVNRYTTELAPVYDNGNAFFNKRADSVMQRSLEDTALFNQDIVGSVSFFTDNEDKHIHPLNYIATRDNPECNAALLRFAQAFDLDKIQSIITEIPETAFGLEVITPIQKNFYCKLIETTYEEKLKPVITLLSAQHVS